MKSHRKTLAGYVIGAIPGLAIAVAVALLLLSKYVLPYQPFVVRDIDVQARCVNGPATVLIDRKFIGGIDSLGLTESWVTVRVPELQPGVTVQPPRHDELPEDKLTEPRKKEFVTVESPLIQEAPPLPGIYKIKIETHAFGTRWGIFPTDYERTFTSDPVKVTECSGKE